MNVSLLCMNTQLSDSIMMFPAAGPQMGCKNIICARIRKSITEDDDRCVHRFLVDIGVVIATSSCQGSKHDGSNFIAKNMRAAADFSPFMPTARPTRGPPPSTCRCKNWSLMKLAGPVCKSTTTQTSNVRRCLICWGSGCGRR